jgi:hypothetical protein
MHEESRNEFSMVRRMFGDECRLTETAARRGRRGQVQILLAGRVLGVGESFRQALQVALQCATRQMPGFGSFPVP